MCPTYRFMAHVTRGKTLKPLKSACSFPTKMHFLGVLFTAVVLSSTNLDGRLIDAIEQGDRYEVGRLIKEGADANAQNGMPLVEAALKGNVDIVKLLLDAGADANAQYGNALGWAASMGGKENVKLLLDHNANVYFQNGRALREAAWNGHEGIVEMILEKWQPIETVFTSSSDGDSAKESLTANVQLTHQFNAKMYIVCDDPAVLSFLQTNQNVRIENANLVAFVSFSSTLAKKGAILTASKSYRKAVIETEGGQWTVEVRDSSCDDRDAWVFVDSGTLLDGALDYSDGQQKRVLQLGGKKIGTVLRQSAGWHLNLFDAAIVLTYPFSEELRVPVGVHGPVPSLKTLTPTQFVTISRSFVENYNAAINAQIEQTTSDDEKKLLNRRKLQHSQWVQIPDVQLVVDEETYKVEFLQSSTDCDTDCDYTELEVQFPTEMSLEEYLTMNGIEHYS